MSWRVHMLYEESWLLPPIVTLGTLLAVSRLAKGYRRRAFVIVGDNVFVRRPWTPSEPTCLLAITRQVGDALVDIA